MGELIYESRKQRVVEKTLLFYYSLLYFILSLLHNFNFLLKHLKMLGAGEQFAFDQERA